MGSEIPSDRLTRREIAWELAEIFDELRVDQLNEMVAINVPLDTLEFFASYAQDFCTDEEMASGPRGRLPNLMLLGYLMRLLEERLPVEPEPFDA
jgi:hypothetical protein